MARNIKVQQAPDQAVCYQSLASLIVDFRNSTMSAREKRRIQRQIDALKSFPNTKTVRKLRKELQEKLRRIELQLKKTKKGRQTRLPVSRKETQRQANLARSRKVHKYHNYIRQIVENYTDLTYSQVRKQFKERKQGKHTEIPDVIWRNPSP